MMFLLKGNKKVRFKSVWQESNMFSYYSNIFLIFSLKNKGVVDLIFFSFFYKKFLNNYSLNYNYSKIYNKTYKELLNLYKKEQIKGFFFLHFLSFSLLFSLFFESTDVKIAGRYLKVPNPLMFNTSYRKLPKILSAILKKKKEKSLEIKLKNEFNLFDFNGSATNRYFNEKINESIENRMFGHFRWKNINLKGYTSRLNP